MVRILCVTLPLLLLFVACAKREATPPPTPAADHETQKRPTLTAAQCEADGGTVVGDIGTGEIHRPEYRCPESGAPPVGDIVPEPAQQPGGPIAVEGSVCCR